MKRLPAAIAIIVVIIILAGCIKPGSAPGGNVAGNVAGSNGTDVDSTDANNSTANPPPSSGLWAITLGGPNTDKAWAVTTDKSGSIYLADYETVPGPWADINLYKLSSDGDTLWKSRWGGPWADQSFIIAEDGGKTYVAGTHFTGMLHDTSDAAVVAFDESGRELWNFTYDAGGYEEIDGLVVDGDYIYASGWTAGNGTQEDILLLKLDKNGNAIWKKAWGSNGWDEANGQMVVDDDTIYVAGRYDADNMLAGGDSLLAAFNKSSGDYLWHRTWGNKGFDDAFGMASDGTDLYVVGLTLTHGDGGQIFLIKYDKSGSEVWERLWGGKGSESSRVVLADSESVYVVGKTDSYGNGKNDIVLVRYSKDGDEEWYRTWGGAGVDESHGATMSGNHIYIAGETDSYGNGKQDALLIKVDKSGTLPQEPEK